MSGGALAKPGERATSVMQQVADELQRRAPTLAQLLPAEITPERMRALALTSIRKTPKLMECSPQSIVGCVYEAAKLGLQPDTATADCHIIPRKGEATFIVGYHGLMKLVRRAIPMATIKAEHVRAADEFVWREGLSPVLEHTRAPAGDREGSPVTYAYAIARFPNRTVEFKVVDAEDIARARKTAKSTAWDHHEGSMWEKTAIKRLCKTLPIDDPAANPASSSLFRAIQLDNAADDQRTQDLMSDTPLEGEVIDASFDDDTPPADQCEACGYKRGGHEDGCPEAP